MTHLHWNRTTAWLPWWCCRGWHWTSLVCALDVVTMCGFPRICRWHDRLITEAVDEPQ